MTYNWFLTNTTKTIRKNSNILQVIENLKEIFKNEPITAFKRNKNIQEVIGNRKWKSQKKKVNAHHAGQKLEMYVARKWKLQQHSRANKQAKLGRNFTVQTLSQYVICLMECLICNLLYVSKNETPFSIRWNNYRKDVKDPKVILADKKLW